MRSIPTHLDVRRSIRAFLIHLRNIGTVVFCLFFFLQAMTPPEYGLEEFVVGVEALDILNMLDRVDGDSVKVGSLVTPASSFLILSWSI